MRYRRLLLALGLSVMLVVSAASPIVAHETKTVEGYDLTFGGANKPLITGERIWLELEIADTETDDQSKISQRR